MCKINGLRNPMACAVSFKQAGPTLRPACCTAQNFADSNAIRHRLRNFPPSCNSFQPALRSQQTSKQSSSGNSFSSLATSVPRVTPGLIHA